MSYKHTPEPWRIEKLHTRRVIRGANDSLVGVIESGMSDEDAARLEQRLSTPAPTDPAKALELAREAISDTLASINFMLADGSALAANSIARDVVRGYLTNAPNKLEAALAALTPTKEVDHD